ncbi:restriction endonuclease subunit S [Helicobacter jaachi]|uniref:restriction endonuclease subunit S n=1 Tax=Helicobacter jaachi TaxID=1677920 RepID=UPI0008518FE8|nr:restriction endonuclease subunit S [Helicobacter jaachi]
MPSTWTWVRLGDICEIVNTENIAVGKLPILDVKYLRNLGDKKFGDSGNFVSINDRLILMDGENSGEIFIARENGYLGSTLKKIIYKQIVSIKFMDFLLLSIKDFLKDNKKGAAIPHLDRKLFFDYSLALPPLKEQEVIARVLESLFTLTKGLRVE